MIFNTTSKHFAFIAVFAVCLSVILSSGARAAIPVVPLSQCFLNRPSVGSIEQIQNEARGQAETSPVFSSGYNGHERVFIGDFIPAQNDVLLAVFADDGADVSRAEQNADGTWGGFIPLVGRFGVGQHLPDLAQSFQVIDVPWTAGKRYRLKIHYKNVSYSLARDVDGLTLFAFNGGGTIEDVIYPQDSEATLRVFKDAALTEEVTGSEVGGKVYLALEVYVGAHQKLNSTNCTARVTDAWPNYTTQNKSFDESFNLTNGAGWQKRMGQSTSWSNAGEAPSTPNLDETPVTYRKSIQWDTTVKPLGNNGTHNIAATGELSFAPTDEGDPYNGGPAAVSVDVKNLVIESATANDSAEYFLVQPGQTQPVNFQVTLDDYDFSQPYTLTLTIRHTADAEAVLKTIRRTASGRNHQLSWDLKDEDGNDEAPFGGYYTFDLSVSKGDDAQVYRSSYLKILEDEVDFEQEAEGNYIVNESGHLHVIFKYKMNEVPLSDSVAIHFFEDLEYKDSESGISEQTRWEENDPPVKKWLSLSEEPSVRGILQARDDRKASYRNHLSKRMLNFNQGASTLLKYVALSFHLIGPTQKDTWMSEFGRVLEWKKVWSKAEKKWMGWNGTKWVVHTDQANARWHENDWGANSGHPDYPTNDPQNSSTHVQLNSDFVGDYWREDGPIPLSKTVKENGDKESFVITPGNFDTTFRYAWTNSVNGWTWMDTTSNDSSNRNAYAEGGHATDFSTDSDKNVYKGFRITILNRALNINHNPEKKYFEGTHDQRNGVFLHSDGGRIGTIGCVGFRPGEFQKAWKRLSDLFKIIKATRPKDKRGIPFFVYSRNSTVPDGNTMWINPTPPTDWNYWLAKK